MMQVNVVYIVKNSDLSGNFAVGIYMRVKCGRLNYFSISFFVYVVFSCQFPSRQRTKCKDVSSKEDCPKTCCFDITTTPNCYFQKSGRNMSFRISLDGITVICCTNISACIKMKYRALYDIIILTSLPPLYVVIAMSTLTPSRP